MAPDDQQTDDERSPSMGPIPGSHAFASMTEAFIHYVELVAAAVFAILFAIGVVDLSL